MHYALYLSNARHLAICSIWAYKYFALSVRSLVRLPRSLFCVHGHEWDWWMLAFYRVFNKNKFKWNLFASNTSYIGNTAFDKFTAEEKREQKIQKITSIACTHWKLVQDRFVKGKNDERKNEKFRVCFSACSCLL